MGYYIRILGKKTGDIQLNTLLEKARPALLQVSEGSEATWEQLVMAHVSGQEIAVIEKNLVIEGALGAEELQEFMDEVALLRPESASAWLRQFFPAVKVIYAFQLLSGTDADDGWTLLHRVYSEVWTQTGGILQADGEGFTDEEGFTIVWQFGETVTGLWNMGVLQNGHWVHFEMDLGNQQHRNAFLRGEVPEGVSTL